MTLQTFDIRHTVRVDRGVLGVTLDLAHGGRVRAEIGYERCGPFGAPTILVAGGISAGRHVLANPIDRSPGWWQAQHEALQGHDLIAIDFLGSEGAHDVVIDPADQAQAMLVVLDHLGIARVAAFVGASYGAMVGMHLATIAPDRVGSLLAFAAAHRPHPLASAGRAIQRRLIEWGEESGELARGVGLARQVAMLSYRCEEEFADRFGGEGEILDGRLRLASDDWLDHHAGLYAGRHPVAYRRLSESIDLHRIDPARITVPTQLVAVDTDRIVPLADVQETARLLPHGRLSIISSPYGHDAFLKESAAVGAIITPFLTALETRS